LIATSFIEKQITAMIELAAPIINEFSLNFCNMLLYGKKTFQITNTYATSTDLPIFRLSRRLSLSWHAPSVLCYSVTKNLIRAQYYSDKLTYRKF
jgi:hypothetical protein